MARFVGQMNFIPATACEEPGRVRVGDTQLRHLAREPLAPGTPVTLAIRPEEIRIDAVTTPGENRLLTRVRAVQFLGPFTRLSLTVPGAAGGILECDVAANAFAELRTAEGAELALGLGPEALRVFASES